VSGEGRVSEIKGSKRGACCLLLESPPQGADHIIAQSLSALIQKTLHTALAVKKERECLGKACMHTFQMCS